MAIFLYEGEKEISSKAEHRVNERIRSEKVRLVDENGENAGIVDIAYALHRAEDVGLDLVEIAPNANPPVVKIINYSKFLIHLQHHIDINVTYKDLTIII